MPGKQKYFLHAVLLICFGLMAVSTQLSLWVSIKSSTADCRDDNPGVDGVNDPQSPWSVDVMENIPFFSLLYSLPNIQCCTYPHTDAFLLQPYFAVATPPPWNNN